MCVTRFLLSGLPYKLHNDRFITSCEGIERFLHFTQSRKLMQPARPFAEFADRLRTPKE